MAAAVTTGTTLAGFRIESLIREGAMGAVYLAEDTMRGGQVALKLLVPQLAQDDRFRQRFLRESRLAATLDHPHIVPIVAAGEEDGVLYLAMPYVDGSDLRELLRREGRLEPERTLHLVGQVAEALDAAHAAGLVHRDVKPGNILVTSGSDGERACVCDFGLARHVSTASSLTTDRGFVGTIDYIAPEQVEGGPLDGRADVYSLGCVLFECLGGAPPFDRESDLSIVFAHLNEPPPSLSDLRPDLEAFDAVFATALAKSPGDRYSTCGELAEAARAALKGEVARPWRRRPLLLAAALLAATAAAIAGILISGDTGGTAAAITPTSIAGAKLGQPESAYRNLFGKPWYRWVQGTSGHEVLTFPDRKLSVYFKGLSDTAVEIVTWNKTYRTAEGIGPCSPVGQMKKTLGQRVRPSPFNTAEGKVYSYLVDKNLIFAANGPPPHPAERVTAVGLYYSDAPAANEEGGALSYAGYLAIDAAEVSDLSC